MKATCTPPHAPLAADVGSMSDEGDEFNNRGNNVALVRLGGLQQFC